MSDISLSKAVRTNLLSLQSTADMMAKTQERLATGNKVNSALDNPTNFFTASSLNSRAGDLNALMDSMSNGIKTLEAADNGLSSITKTLESMQSTLRQARQDKSFQNGVYEVTKDSVITVDGGQFSLPTDIKLGTQTPGIKAELKTTAAAAYHGPVISTNASEDGIGARTLISASGTGLADGAVIKVAGMDVTIDDGGDSIVSDTELASQINSVINAVGSPERNKYTVSVGGAGSPNAGKVILETVDPTKPAPAVSFTSGATPAVKAATTFNYSAVTSSLTVGTETIATGATYEQFIANLTASEEAGGYSVSHDPVTKNITLTAVAHGDPAPGVTGVKANQPQTAATNSIDLSGASTGSGPATYTIDGVSLTIASNLTTPGDVYGDLNSKLALNPTLAARYTPSFNAVTGVMTLTDRTAGANRTEAVVSSTGFTSAPVNDVTFVQGQDAVTGGAVSTPAGVGVWQESVAAHRDTFNVTYDGKTAEIGITGIKGGVGSTAPNAIDIKNWQDATIARVNAELKVSGITGVEAAFDADGKFSIVAKAPEAKSVIISGDDGIALFGNDAVSTGTATIDGYSSTAPVDKFVEEINRAHAGKLRASNDNGKLRIENLSTKELGVSFDNDGAAGPGVPVSSKIAGNSVRENLALQFNDLKNQLDRLSDDASFNGINLLRGDNLKITFNESGNSFIDVQTAEGKGLNSSSLKVQNLQGIDLDTDDGIDKLLNDIKLALSDVRTQASEFGSNLSIVQNRQDFTKQMINTLETGAANLTLADMNEEAANLLALQTRQSLSSSSLSLASQADQSVLQLLQ